MRRHEAFACGCDGAEGLRLQDQLIRIGAPVVAHCCGLTAPDQLGTTRPKTTPASQQEIGRKSLRGPIPPLHRQHGEPVADAPRTKHGGTTQRGVRSGFQN